MTDEERITEDDEARVTEDDETRIIEQGTSTARIWWKVPGG